MSSHKWKDNKCLNCNLVRKAKITHTEYGITGEWFYSYTGEDDWTNKRPFCNRSLVRDTKQIIPTVNNYFGVDVLNKSKKREIVLARQIAIYLLHTFTNMSFKAIGRLFGQDHASAMWSKKKVWDLCKYYPDIRKQVIDLETLIE